MERTATCVCGQLGIQVSGEPTLVAACNCLDCQKRTGSAFGISSYFQENSVAKTFGRCKTFSNSAESGLNAKGHFCPECGSTVYWRHDFMGDHVGIAVGCFADPNFPEPKYSAWEESKHKWISHPDNWLKSEKQDFD